MHTVLCHPRWLPTSGLTEVAVVFLFYFLFFIYLFFYFFGAFASVGLVIHEFGWDPAYRVSNGHCPSIAAWIFSFGGARPGFEPRTALQQSGVLTSRPRLTPTNVQNKTQKNFLTVYFHIFPEILSHFYHIPIITRYIWNNFNHFYPLRQRDNTWDTCVKDVFKQCTVKKFKKSPQKLWHLDPSVD
jgi:hypothetical protein